MINPTLETSNLKAPGFCVFCERTAVEPGNFMVDSGVDNDTPVMTPRTGRLYMCNTCLHTAATVAGYVSRDEVQDKLDTAERVRDEAGQFRADVIEALDSMRALADAIKDAPLAGAGR